MKFSSAATRLTIAILTGSAFGSSSESTQHIRSVVSVASEDVASAYDATVLGHVVSRELNKYKAKGSNTAKTPKVPKSSTKMPKGPKSEEKVPKSAKGMVATASPTSKMTTAQPSTPQPSPQPSSPPTDPCDAIKTQKDALLALKAGFTNADDTDLSTWDAGTEPCDGSWTDVTCDTGSVTKIDLGKFNMVW